MRIVINAFSFRSTDTRKFNLEIVPILKLHLMLAPVNKKDDEYIDTDGYRILLTAHSIEGEPLAEFIDNDERYRSGILQLLQWFGRK